MNTYSLRHGIAAVALIFLSPCAISATSHLVHSMEEFTLAAKGLEPGDEIVLANGNWHNSEFVLEGRGSAEQPIRLTAQEPGKVRVTGESNLSISGEHIVVSDLVFVDGFTPTSEVIAFRTSKDEVANYTRVTNTVIDGFSNPERYSSDIWVTLYGKHNRFDHNTLINKGNSGVTLAVRMNTRESQENEHIIEYNYFGPRQTLGSNGGETLRIGTSHYSREYSNTIVRNNFFDRTGGELEIISSKSCGNEIRDNVFFESQGTLTMRHGHHTLVESNYFLGNRKANTGGIRVINGHQTVRNNYLYGLTGYRFYGALVVMNGVPNGPINRYDPVVESVIENNIVANSDHIQLCAGSDAERSAPPTSTRITNNTFMSETNKDPFTIYDDISGIEFRGNRINEGLNLPIEQGFSRTPYALQQNDYGLFSPSPSILKATGLAELRLPVEKASSGADFYPKHDLRAEFRSGTHTQVAPGTNTLREALLSSQDGDVLVLENGAEYLLTKYAVVPHTVSIMSPKGPRAIIRSEKANFFTIANGGSLELENLWIDGADSPDIAGNSVISTDRYSMNQNYALVVRNINVTDLDVNHSFGFLKTYRSTFADRIEILDSQMSNVTGDVLSLNNERDDLGIYNAENVVIRGSTFTDVQGAIANIYRGGTDESTFGPIVDIAGNTFNNVGHGKRNKANASMAFHGVQKLKISDSNWQASAPIDLHLTNGEPITIIEDIVLSDTGPIRANRETFVSRNIRRE